MLNNSFVEGITDTLTDSRGRPLGTPHTPSSPASSPGYDYDKGRESADAPSPRGGQGSGRASELDPDEADALSVIIDGEGDGGEDDDEDDFDGATAISGATGGSYFGTAATGDASAVGGVGERPTHPTMLSVPEEESG
jgi:hypothetical protein